MSYELRLIRPAWLALATPGSLSREGADRHRGPCNGLRRRVRDRRGCRSTGWRAARRGRARGARRAEARASSGAGRRAGGPPARPGALLQSWGLAEKAPWQAPDQAAIPNRLATKVA